MSDTNTDTQKYDTALETAAWLARTGKPDVAVRITEELFRMLACEKETRSGALGLQPHKATEMEELLVKKYLEFKGGQKMPPQGHRGYVSTFIKTLIVCSVITIFLIIGVFFVAVTVRNGVVAPIRMAISGGDTGLSNLRLSRIYALIYGDPKMFFRVGQIYEEGGDLNMALLYVSRAKHFDPNNKIYRAKYNELEKRLGRYTHKN